MFKPSLSPAERVSSLAAEWCKKNPAWMRICDLPDTDCYYVQWAELSDRQKADWGSEYAYNEFATKRKKVRSGFVTDEGNFVEDVFDIFSGHDFMMVFRVGIKAAKTLGLNPVES